MTWLDFVNKKVFILVETTVGERRYTGVVTEVTYVGKTLDGVENYILLLDNGYTGKLVGFATSQIKLIQEEK